MKVVTWNIRYGHDIERAIEALTSLDRLQGTDAILLQEMDEAGTRAVAEALGLHYAYGSASVHPRSTREFGNAVLSRWELTARWWASPTRPGSADNPGWPSRRWPTRRRAGWPCAAPTPRSRPFAPPGVRSSHVFARGLTPIEAGVVRNVDASDYAPVWVVLEPLANRFERDGSPTEEGSGVRRPLA